MWDVDVCIGRKWDKVRNPSGLQSINSRFSPSNPFVTYSRSRRRLRDVLLWTGISYTD